MSSGSNRQVLRTGDSFPPKLAGVQNFARNTIQALVSDGHKAGLHNWMVLKGTNELWLEKKNMIEHMDSSPKCLQGTLASFFEAKIFVIAP